MSKYVKREEIARVLSNAMKKAESTRPDFDEGWMDACEYMQDMIDAISPANVAEVTCCKDCVYYRAKIRTNGNCIMHDMAMFEEDYCSWGKSHENE